MWYRWAVRQTLSGSSSITTTLDSSDVHHGPTASARDVPMPSVGGFFGRVQSIESTREGRPVRINSAVDWTAKEWQRVAHAALVIAAVSFTSLVFLLFQSIRNADERLIGTWQSDADRTVAGILCPTCDRSINSQTPNSRVVKIVSGFPTRGNSHDVVQLSVKWTCGLGVFDDRCDICTRFKSSDSLIACGEGDRR